MSARLDIPAPQYKPVDYDPFEGGAESLLYFAPSTEAQQEIWSACQIGDDASCAFNECVSLEFRGALQIDALRHALQKVVERNEALRMTFAPGGEQFCVAAAASYDFRFETCVGGELEALRRAAVEEPFDLVHGPLFRAWLAQLSDERSELILSTHHIVCDGWAMGIIVSELAAEYTSYAEQREPDLPEPERFLDYADEQRRYQSSRDFQIDQSFWTEQFRDDIPQLDLPLDRARPPSRGYESGRVDHCVPIETVTALRRVAARHGCSLAAAAQAVFQVLLHRLTGQTSVVIGMPAAGQAMFGRDRLVGHCVNLLPVRAELDGELTFSELLERNKTLLGSVYDHQKYTYGSLLKRLPMQRDPSRLPLVSVMFNLDPGWTQEHLAFAGLHVDIRSNPRSYENFELFVNGVCRDDGLVLEAQYKKELFERDTIAAWMRSYHHLVEQLTADPAVPLNRVPLLADEDFGRVIHDWNETRVSDRELPLVHESIERQARLSPDVVAIVDVRGETSYRELEARSNQLARFLMLNFGVQPGERVGVAVDRGADMVISLLAVLKAGAAYVPLDPDYPSERLGYMLKTAAVNVVVTDSQKQALLPLGDACAVCIDTDWNRIAACSDNPVTAEDGPRPRAEDVAYVIFTSGSTGLPKGVQVLHLGVANFLHSMQKEPGLQREDVLLAVTTLSFDIAVLELYLPLMVGARIVMASRDDAMDAHRLAAMIADREVTILQATPATWRMLLAVGWQGLPGLKALCGGEALTRDLVEALLERGLELWNMYGPTETTVWSTCCRIIDVDSPITIGLPIDNTQVYVLNEAGLPQPPGAVGELYIAGDGVALGYVAREDLTKELFRPNPFVSGGRMYKTGDLGRWRSDGRLECLGRTDGQVKVRGFRIEIGEIEAVLMGSGLLTECSVIVREDNPGDQRLVAYYSASREVQAETLKALAQKKLPAYMVPQNWLQMEALPKTLNGKIDRKRLPKPGAPRSMVSARPESVPWSQTETLLHQLWQEVLQRDDFDIEDDFFLLGGHSLLATQLLTRIQQAGRAAPTLRELFRRPTVKQLAEWIDRQEPNEQLESIPRMPGRSRAPLSTMQMRVWYLEQINPGTAAYHLPAAFRIEGQFDVDTANAAWREIIERHSSLRTRVVIEDGEPVQAIEEQVVGNLPLVVCTEVEMLERATADAKTPFDLELAPLLRGTIFRLAPQRHVLYFVAHHLIWDGWSFDVFLREFKEIYEARVRGRTPNLPALEIAYADYCEWQRMREPSASWFDQEKTFWLKQLEGPLPTLDLPADHARPPQMSLRGATYEFAWDEQTIAQMTEFARQRGVTLQMLLLAGFKALLSGLSGSPDILVGVPIQGRTARETEDLIGFFVNTLVLRTLIEPDAPFASTLERVREVCLDAFAHQRMPFDTLVQAIKPKRDLSRTPIFQCFFTYQDVTRREWTLGDAEVEQINIHTNVVATDVSLWVKVGHRGLVGGIDYATDLFELDTVREWADRYLRILRAAMAEPNQRVSQLTAIVGSTAASPKDVNRQRQRTKAQHAPEMPSSENADMEVYLLSVWRDMLGVEEIVETDNFFDLGGHSLLSMQMIARIEKDTGKRLSPRTVLLSSFNQVAAELAGRSSTRSQAASKREMLPFFFAEGLFGTLHSPVKATGSGVLICAPIGQEYMRTHWLFRQLANALARKGMYVLRFDYFGCGDSAGASLAGGPTRWIEDVRVAAEELARRAAVEKVVVIGARMGGYLAAAALPDHDLVLWDPITSGREYLAELESVHREKFDGALPTEESGLGGFAFSEALKSEIAQIELGTVVKRCRNVHIIDGTELGEDAGWSSAGEWNHAVLSRRIVEALKEAYAEVSDEQ